LTTIENLTTENTLRLFRQFGADEAVSYIMRLQVFAHDHNIRLDDLLCYYDIQEKGEAEIVGIAPLVFTHAIVSGIDQCGYNDRWCYHSYAAAKAALDAWDGTGEPSGWHRNPRTGRRRDENGNEEVRW
jgi:hypothetical protein